MLNTFLRTVFWFCSVLFSLAITASCANATTGIHGYIYESAEKKPIPGVSIHIVGSAFKATGLPPFFVPVRVRVACPRSLYQLE